MSHREFIQVFHPLDIQRYLWVLTIQFHARPNLEQSNTFLIDDPPLPFYRPKRLEKYVSILGFNYSPFSSLLILALIDHPDLAPATSIVRWMAEQETVAQGTLADLTRQFGESVWRTGL